MATATSVCHSGMGRLRSTGRSSVPTVADGGRPGSRPSRRHAVCRSHWRRLAGTCASSGPGTCGLGRPHLLGPRLRGTATPHQRVDSDPGQDDDGHLGRQGGSGRPVRVPHGDRDTDSLDDERQHADTATPERDETSDGEWQQSPVAPQTERADPAGSAFDLRQLSVLEQGGRRPRRVPPERRRRQEGGQRDLRVSNQSRDRSWPVRIRVRPSAHQESAGPPSGTRTPRTRWNVPLYASSQLA